MKQLIVFIFVVFSFANDYEIKLYETIFTKLFQKKQIKIYVDENQKSFKNSKILKLVSCKEADVILLYKLQHLKLRCKYKPIFVTSYLDYIHSNAIGAFYWRKGRPQLILNKKMIKYYHLFLDKSLLKYVK